MMAKSRDIAPVLHLLAPTREGGLEQAVTMMSAGQMNEGVHVAAVLTPRDTEAHPFLIRLEALGVPVTPIVVGGRSYLREYRSLGTLVGQLRPRILHTHGYRADLIGGAVARAHRVPTVSTVHGFTGARLRIRVDERVQCVILRRADAVIAVSAPLVDRLAKAGIPRGKIHCVPNGFAPTVKSVSRLEARDALGISGTALVAGWVGRLSREKGVDVLLEALAQANPGWRLSIVGDGPERHALRQLAEKLGILDRISWHGSVANAGSLFAAFDAFVLSSRTEGTPITLLEAMSAGVPIVATQVGGVPDVVSSAHAILVPSEQPGMIAKALGEVEREPAAAARRSTLAQQRLLKSFGSDNWLAAVERVYAAAGARPAYDAARPSAKAAART